jgi:uncharacterized protein (TIGR00369 family)
MPEAPPEWPDRAKTVLGLTPFTAGIGAEILEIANARSRLRLAYSEALIGDPETGVVHGGVITAMLDHASGMAVMAALDAPFPIATLDLRIDYMRRAEPGEAILAEAHCLKVTREIAFVRGTAHHGNADEPIAISTSAFMLMRNAPPRP